VIENPLSDSSRTGWGKSIRTTACSLMTSIEKLDMTPFASEAQPQLWPESHCAGSSVFGHEEEPRANEAAEETRRQGW
jgi:hypothetical protein